MMRNMMMPFGNPFGMMQPALTDGGQHRSYRHQMGGRHTDHDDFALAPRNMFDDMFMNMGRMMNPDFVSVKFFSWGSGEIIFKHSLEAKDFLCYCAGGSCCINISQINQLADNKSASRTINQDSNFLRSGIC